MALVKQVLRGEKIHNCDEYSLMINIETGEKDGYHVKKDGQNKLRKCTHVHLRNSEKKY